MRIHADSRDLLKTTVKKRRINYSREDEAKVRERVESQFYSPKINDPINIDY